MKIVIDDKIPYIQGAFEPFADVLYLPGATISKEDLRDADALITRTRTICNEDLLKGSSVKFIATATIGFDHIDTAYCKKAGIEWTNAPGCNSGSVLQYIASVFSWLILEQERNFSRLSVGVVGAGNVGGKVVRLCKTLGINVLVNDPPRALKEGHEGFVSFDDILEKADVITFHVPLERETEFPTFHMVNKEVIKKMSKKPVLINSSRGEVVSNEDVFDAMQSGLLSNLVLDVWEDEPNILPGLLQIVDHSTPHIAGYSADGKANGSTMSVHAIANFFDLPLLDWSPENVPEPAIKELTLDCSGMSVFEAFAYAVKFTYNITRDTELLKASPDKFEWFRGNYPVRREFGSFHIKLSHASDVIRNALVGVGFMLS